METILLKYISVILVLYLAFINIPKNYMFIDDIYLFIGVGVIIFYLFDNYVYSIEAEFFAEDEAEADTEDEDTEDNNTDDEIKPVNTVQTVSTTQPTTQPTNSSQPISKSVLTDTEITQHVNYIVANVNNQIELDKINAFMLSIQKVDADRGSELIKIYNLTLVNPSMVQKIVLSSPSKILDVANMLVNIPELKETILKGVEANAENNTVEVLSEKIASLEKIITGLQLNKTNVPEFLKQMIDQGKYIDKNGIVKDMLYGDMQYNQLKPAQMQSQMSRDDDDWDTTGYTILNTDKWKPPESGIRDVYQEGECPVCPSMTSGYPVNVLDFDKSRYVMGADNISVDYINKLNDKKKY